MAGDRVDPARDYEAVLGVRRGCTPQEARAAWRRAVRRLHPDVGGDPAAFDAARRAYEVLADPDAARRWRSLRAAADHPGWVWADGLRPPGRPAGDRTPGGTGPGGAGGGRGAAPRPVRAQLVRPTRAGTAALAAGAVGAVLLALLPALAGPRAPLPVAALPAALAATAVGWTASLVAVRPGADPPVRAQVLAAAWAAVTAVQLAASALAGAGLLAVLPLTCVPLVVATGVLLLPRHL